MEPRARAGRHKTSLNFGDELKHMIYAAGAPVHPDIKSPHPDSNFYLATPPTENRSHAPTPFSFWDQKEGRRKGEPYPETLRVMDEMVTDFIIETCHQAVAVASYSGRAKLKLADFEWVIRKDRQKLGRVQELLRKKKDIEQVKKSFQNNEDGKMAVNDLVDLGHAAGEEGTGKGKGRGRGRRKKRNAEEMNDVGGIGGMGAEGDGTKDDGEDERRAKKARSETG